MKAKPKTKAKKRKFFIGIDEVGRGPLAGPVAVGAVLATPRMIRRFRAIKESKQLSPRAREEWNERITTLSGDELLFAVSFVSAKIIDSKGITFAIRTALHRSLKKLSADPNSVNVLLDGGLRAPEEYKNQKTIIRGDATETVIAMASVVAKVARDQYMVRLHKKFPQYDFPRHKGYGTSLHVAAIKKHGISVLHRKSFCGNFS